MSKILYKGVLFICLLALLLPGCTTLPDSERITNTEPSQTPGNNPLSLTQIQDRGVLVVGTAITKPFEFYDPDTGTLIGFDVDIATHIAKELDVEIEWVEMPFANLIPALQANKINMTIAAMYIKPEREALVDFAEPYLNTGLVMVVRPELFDQVKSTQDLAGLNVGVKIGATGATLADELVVQGIALEKKEYVETFDSLLDFEVGRLDVVFNDYLNTLTYLRDYQSELKIATTNTGEVDFLSQAGLGIAVHKNNQTLLTAIDAELDKMKQDGTIDRLHKIWLTPSTGQ